jgi:hypothetical protein
MTGKSKGLTILDTAGAPWLSFTYKINSNAYSPSAGFLGKFVLGERKFIYYCLGMNYLIHFITVKH